MKRLFPLLLFLFLISGSAVGQQFYWQGGVFAGIGNYTGDINPMATPDLSESGLSAGVVGHVYVSPKIGFRGSLLYANLQGDDRKYEEREGRNFRFNTQLIELAGLMEWEPFGSNRYFANAAGDVVMDRLISPYFFTGIAVGLASLDTDFSGYMGNNPEILGGIREDEQQGNSATFLAIPVGVGIKFDLTEQFTLALEVGGRLALTDMIDGISAAAGSGDDQYFASGLLLYYRFTQ